MKTPETPFIALVALVMSFGLTIFVFVESRNDPGLRMAALVSATSTVSAFIAIASTLLTGKDLSKPGPPNTNPTPPSSNPQQPEGPAQ